jgi:hypothetical protein
MMSFGVRMSRLGNCVPCAAAAGNPMPMLGSYKSLGNCASCAAATMGNTIPLLGSYQSGFGDWFEELKDHLKPMTPWLIAVAIVAAMAGYKFGTMRGLKLCLDAAEIKKVVGARRKKRNKRKRRKQ